MKRDRDGKRKRDGKKEEKERRKKEGMKRKSSSSLQIFFFPERRRSEKMIENQISDPDSKLLISSRNLLPLSLSFSLAFFCEKNKKEKCLSIQEMKSDLGQDD